jgi:glucosylceramidase
MKSNSVMTGTMWLTSADRSCLLHAQALSFQGRVADVPNIMVDSSHQYQSIEGFGFALTGGSAMLLSGLATPQRQALLRELFAREVGGIGVSMLRLSIGASDLSSFSYSYDDRPPGQSDFELAHFDLFAGDQELIPLLQEILAINPALKLIAAPWSAPPWMKSNQRFIGGSLRPDCQSVYAAYLVKYLTTMRELGISVHAITPQNEPQNSENEPSMLMDAYQQSVFIAEHLAPQLREAGLGDVEILCWDHNCDAPEYPLQVLKQAGDAASGSAWHLYGGEIEVLSQVHAAYPHKKIYFTEQWVGADGEFGGDLLWHIKHVLIGSLNHWSCAVLEWNLAADSDCKPHTPKGGSRCLGALSIDGERITRNAAYYIIGHAAYCIPPGSRRIASRASLEWPHVALLTPDRQCVLLILNEREQVQPLAISACGAQAQVSIPPRSVATLVWPMT